MKRLIVVFLFIFNCAYYNTFYNAKKYYDEGLRLEVAGKNGAHLFKKSAEKCEKIIDIYSGSGWVDDAIFLLGRNHYHLNQLSDAKIRFNQIVDYYPDSPFVERSLIFLGKIAVKEGRWTEALFLLDKATDSEDLDIRMEAFKTKLEIHLQEDSPEAVINAGKDFIEKYGTYKAEVYKIIGDAYNRIGKYSQALRMYEKSINESGEGEPEGLRFCLASAYMNLDSLQQALNIIPENNQVDSMTILKGQILRKMGKFKEAEETLEFARNFRNRLGATANYEMGLIKEADGDSLKAKEFYSTASNLGDFGSITKMATSRENILIYYSSLKSDSIADDTVSVVVRDPAYIYFRIGEIYYTELDDIGRAVEEYKKVFADYPESEYAPKALYVLLYIHSRVLTDSSSASHYLSILKERYPKVRYSIKAMEEFGDYLQDTTGYRE